MLRAARVVIIVGRGGVGKTRLATRLAHQVRRVFRDGVVWVDLAAYHEPASLSPRSPRHSVSEPQGQPVGEAVTAYLRSPCAAAGAGQLRAPGRRVRAASSSRAAARRARACASWPPAASRWGSPASGLMRVRRSRCPCPDRGRRRRDGPASTRWSPVRRAGPARSRRDFELDDANAEAVAQTLPAARRHPAGDRAGRRSAPGAVPRPVRRTAGRPLRPADGGPRAAPPRHQTLRGWSTGATSCAHRPSRRCGPGCRCSTAAPTSTLCRRSCGGPGPRPVFEALAGLVDKSVLVPESGGRSASGCSRPIREYGADRLAEQGETERCRDRHLDHYLAVARESRAAWFGPDQLELLARTTADLGNLRVAFERALMRPGEHQAALELCSALVWYWKPSGALDEGARWFDRALRNRGFRLTYRAARARRRPACLQRTCRRRWRVAPRPARSRPASVRADSGTSRGQIRGTRAPRPPHR